MLPIETDRLLLREFTALDFQLFIDLNSDPEVIKYTGDSAFKDEEGAMEILCFVMNQYKEHGYGRLAVFEKDTGEFVGFCGLKFHPEEKETDLGYRLKKKYWNKGYATEASIACLNFGFTSLNLTRIVAHAMSQNTKSIHVLEKLGMSFVKDMLLHDEAAKLYVLDKLNWNAKLI